MAQCGGDKPETFLSGGAASASLNGREEGVSLSQSLLQRRVTNAHRIARNGQLFSLDTVLEALLSRRLVDGPPFVLGFSVNILKALVTAKLQCETYLEIINATAGVVFLGTPHRGSKSQSKASIIAAIASAMDLGEKTSILKIVETDSEPLRDLVYDFSLTVNTVSIPLFCFFEQRATDVAAILRPKKWYHLKYEVGLKSLVPSRV